MGVILLSFTIKPLYNPLKFRKIEKTIHNWNDGILEKWNDRMAPFGQINAGGARN
jgi:hypothetical protein